MSAVQFFSRGACPFHWNSCDKKGFQLKSSTVRLCSRFACAPNILSQKTRRLQDISPDPTNNSLKLLNLTPPKIT